jgi:hypothetical protein
VKSGFDLLGFFALKVSPAQKWDTQRSSFELRHRRVGKLLLARGARVTLDLLKARVTSHCCDLMC